MAKAKPLATWPHYARPALAQTYLAQARTLGVRAFTIFAPRGWGKSQFLKRDLIPAARKVGLRVVYVDLWSMDEPASAIVAALDSPESTAAGVARLGAAFGRLVRSPLAGAKAGIHIARAKAELEAKFALPDVGAKSVQLASAFKRLMRADRKPVLMILDAIQTLAADRHLWLVRALRAHFQAYDDRMVRIFTGSSRAGLERTLRRSRAPLYGQGGPRIDFPPLDEGFVDLVRAWFTERTGGYDLGRTRCMSALKDLGYSARLFNHAVESVLTGHASDISAAVQAQRDAHLSDAQVIALVAKLSPLQQATLRRIWETGADVYSRESRAHIAKLAGMAAVESSALQGALKRLERAQLIYREEHGQYAIESPEIELLIEVLIERTADRPARR